MTTLDCKAALSALDVNLNITRSIQEHLTRIVDSTSKLTSDLDDARAQLAEQHHEADGTPVEYVRVEGKGRTYAVYGTSSIAAYHAAIERMTEYKKELDKAIESKQHLQEQLRAFDKLIVNGAHALGKVLC